MGSVASNVKPLALPQMLWHAIIMTKTNSTGRDARLAEALRANLRRRKLKPTPSGADEKTDRENPDPAK